MIVFENETDFVVYLSLLEEIASIYTKQEIELILSDNDTLQTLNATHRGKDMPTDVLSFPLEAHPHMPLGSIIISLDFVTHYANELGHSPMEEMTLLFTHGLLHLLGHDHESDKGEMREEEEKVMRQFNLPPSLVVRNNG